MATTTTSVSAYEMRPRTLPSTSSVSPEHLHFVNNHQKWTPTLMFAMLVVTFSTSFVMGVNTGGPNVYNGFIVPWARGYPFPCQKDDMTARWIAQVWWNCDYINVASKNKTGYYYLPAVAPSQLTKQNLIDSFHTICFVAGGALGGLTAQYWFACLTRRNAVFANMFFQIGASILMIIPLEVYHGYETQELDWITIIRVLQNKDLAIALLYISRFLSGYSAGMACVVSTIYLTDISPRTMRGKVITCHQLFIVIGILVGQIIALPWLLGQHNKWNWGMAWVGVFPLVGCFLIWALPESPRYLVQEHQRGEAAKSLQILRHTNAIEAELDEIERQEATVANEDITMLTLFTSPRFRWPLLTSIVLTTIQQFCGINTVFFYSSKTLATVGLIDEKFFLSMVATGMVNLIATIVSLKLVESFGRRPLIIYPLGLISLIMILLCISIQINIAALTVLLVLVFVGTFAIGLGPIPYVYPNEVFPIDVRPVALSISMFTLWFCNTLVSVLFPLVQSLLGGYVFLIFCVCSLMACVFLWYKMPETKRKKLSDIQAFWVKF